jgi:hypothetical protein
LSPIDRPKPALASSHWPITVPYWRLEDKCHRQQVPSARISLDETTISTIITIMVDMITMR